jgi:hypothetical protein
MRTLFSTIVVTALLGSSTQAQTSGQLSHWKVSIGVRRPIGGENNLAPICDGSERRTSENKKRIGTLLEIGGLAALVGQVVSISSSNGTTGSSSALGAVGLGAGIAGFVLNQSAKRTSYWDEAVTKLKRGETTKEEVYSCLGRAKSTSTSSEGEMWTYTTRNSGFGGGSRVLTLTFKSGVLSDMRRSDSGMHQ